MCIPTNIPQGLRSLIEERQRHDGNCADWTIFTQEDRCYCPLCGGFEFSQTSEGLSFWHQVIDLGDLTPYFERYENGSVLNYKTWE